MYAEKTPNMGDIKIDCGSGNNAVAIIGGIPEVQNAQQITVSLYAPVGTDPARIGGCKMTTPIGGNFTVQINKEDTGSAPVSFDYITVDYN